MAIDAALAATPGGVNGPRDLTLAEPGPRSGSSDLIEDIRSAGFDGAAGGPEQARVAVAFLEPLHPGDQATEVVAVSELLAGWPVRLRFEKLGNGGPAQAAERGELAYSYEATRQGSAVPVPGS